MTIASEADMEQEEFGCQFVQRDPQATLCKKFNFKI